MENANHDGEGDVIYGEVWENDHVLVYNPVVLGADCGGSKEYVVVEENSTPKMILTSLIEVVDKKNGSLFIETNHDLLNIEAYVEVEGSEE